ncbi:hypothetical protein [Streptomyces sp. AK08-02]|uniref:hypothetical protein n=1 Tax=Streptomyces sp. AK08-02 TaxID=3028654 RepID=UPI0029A11EAA|nr:hypothetical protein [Streptomyces sp. AK08-02]MDX3747287.1 hypothetical protein [Streptomyces sp. AK08-02]
MPQHVPNTPICRDCDGFATAAITTGTRNANGSRVTVTVACPACNGTGTTRRPVRTREVSRV